MLCSECHENIPQGKEIQIEGTIFCKECDLIIKKENKEKVVARCWNCNRFIYKSELIYEFTKNNSKTFSKWFLIGSENSEKLFQCDECYQKGRKDVKKVQNLSGVRFLLLGFCVACFLNLVLKIFFSEMAEKVNDNALSIIALSFILFIVAIIIEPILNVDRHRVSISKKKSKK